MTVNLPPERRSVHSKEDVGNRMLFSKLHSPSLDRRWPSADTSLALTTLHLSHHALDVLGPALPYRPNAHTAIIVLAHQGLRTDVIVNCHQLEDGLRFPVERNVEIAREHLPFGAIVKFDDMALRMSSKGRPVS